MTKLQALGPLEKLLQNLLREVYQTETSAVKHCQREANRLVATGPGNALLAVRAHAQEAMPDLIHICRREQLPVSVAGGLVGAALSQFRDKVADRLVQSERSYRGTLLGIRHGIDLMRVVRSAADAASKLDLAQFAGEWLRTRIVLTDRVEDELQWFVRHPEHATQLARPLFLVPHKHALQN